MKLCVEFVFNGHRRVAVGDCYTTEEAVELIKEHQFANSAITKPVFKKSLSKKTIRIDYGARDCYYLISPYGKGVENVLHSNGL